MIYSQVSECPASKKNLCFRMYIFKVLNFNGLAFHLCFLSLLPAYISLYMYISSWNLE